MKLLPKLHSPETVVDSCVPWKGYTLLHHAADNGWEDVCKLLVEKCKCDPTSVDHYGQSPLHIACWLGSAASVKYLLSLPSVLREIDAKDKFGRTPLNFACMCKRFAAIESLLETNSVNLTEMDKFGYTPFEILLNEGYSALSRVANQIGLNTQLPVKSFFKVFLVGVFGAGKSTLAAAMVELTKDASTQYGQILNAKEFPTGIVPRKCCG